jgi:hypothetical protein
MQLTIFTMKRDPKRIFAKLFKFKNHREVKWRNIRLSSKKNYEETQKKSYIESKTFDFNLPSRYWKQLEKKQEMKDSRFMKWNNCIN